MSKHWMAVLAAAVLFASAATLPAYAHHSVQATVDTSKQLKGEMVLTRVDWVNPHSWFHFDTTTANGTAVKDVQIEWLSLAGLRQIGVTSANAFAIGDTFQVTYNPNRDGTVGGNMVRMVDEATGRVFDRSGDAQPPPPPSVAPPPLPALRPPTTAISY